MINLFVLNNVRHEEVGQVSWQELGTEKDIHEALLQKFLELGCVVQQGRGELRIQQGGNLIPFDEKLLSSGDAAVVYFDVVRLENAYEFCRKNGIKYFFHTAEQGHWYSPHIHVSYGSSHGGNDEYQMKIGLSNFETEGHLGNRKKTKEAIRFVKENFVCICEEWNRIIESQGGPRWKG